MDDSVRPGKRNLITDVDGLKVGNADDDDALTGVSVVIPDEPAVAGVDVRGGAPGTRESDALRPGNLVERVHGLFLAGGSVFGLAAGDGVTQWLARRGIGFAFGDQPHPCPVVAGAIVFDINNGGDKAWGEEPPYRRLAMAACDGLCGEFPLGNVGAGMGAVAGRLKGGLGSASAVWRGITVGALVAVNSFGSTLDPRSGALWASSFAIGDEMGPPPGAATSGPVSLTAGTKIAAGSARTNTTVAIVATDAMLTPAEAGRLASMADDGLARAIRPVHGQVDGDCVFAMASGRVEVGGERAMVLSLLGTLAADTLARAVGRAMWSAAAVGGHRAYRDGR